MSTRLLVRCQDFLLFFSVTQIVLSLRLSDRLFSTANQQANLHAARVLKQNEEAQAAAKSRLVQAITQAKVGKDVKLIDAPHL